MNAIDNANHEQLEKLILMYQEDLPKCNGLQRAILHDGITKAYTRLVKEGRYSRDFIEEIIKGKNSGFSPEFVAEQVAKDATYVLNVKEGTWADTQGELRTAQKALQKLATDLYWVVNRDMLNSHIQRIKELHKGQNETRIQQ